MHLYCRLGISCSAFCLHWSPDRWLDSFSSKFLNAERAGCKFLWVLLVVANLLIVYWIASSANDWLPIQSITTSLFMPVAAIITMLVMRYAWRKLEPVGELDTSRKSWFTAGMLLIPSLQVGMLVVMWLLTPALCNIGWLVCQEW